MMTKNLKHSKLSALRAAGVLPLIGAGMMLFSFTAKTPEIVYTDAKTVEKPWHNEPTVFIIGGREMAFVSNRELSLATIELKADRHHQITTTAEKDAPVAIVAEAGVPAEWVEDAKNELRKAGYTKLTVKTPDELMFAKDGREVTLPAQSPQAPGTPGTPGTPSTPQATQASLPPLIEVPNEPMLQVEQMPKFQGGGIMDFRNWVQGQVSYPKEAMEADMQGKVVVKFVVEKDGSVSTVEGLKSPGQVLTDEVIRVVKASPKWTPGTHDGKPARVFYVLPVDFTLTGDAEPLPQAEAPNEPIEYVGTFTASGPMMMVDGKEVDNIDDIDPEKIENIEVWKDAAAVAKHGERARNGVIVVTLKKDMVDTGYGAIERSKNTSSISTIDMKNAPHYTNLRDYVRGRVAGVNFVGDQLVIRGVSSINSGIEALVVVDGVQLSSFADANASINPADVESITVLKDAASTAIYGVRGANGVVVIRTKRGR